MAGKLVMQFCCDRCGRDWYDAPESEKQHRVLLQLRFIQSVEAGGAADPEQNLKWEQLCGGCRKTVNNLVQALTKDLKHKSPSSPRRGAKENGGGPEAPHHSTPVAVPQAGHASTQVRARPT